LAWIWPFMVKICCLSLYIISLYWYTGRFKTFFVYTNIYNKKTKWPTLMELFTATRKLNKFCFWQLEMFGVCTTGDTAHIDTIFKFLPHTRQHACIDILHYCNDPWLYVSDVTWQWWDEYFARNARCTVTTDLLCDIPTNKTTPQLERPFSHYIHSHRLAAEMWTTMKQYLLGNKFWVVP